MKIEKKDFEFTSMCALQLACAYELLGKHKEALQTLGLIKNFVAKKGRYDQMVKVI